MAKRKHPRMPPIHLLVAFEAAARCVSFKVAAKELNVTPSAISQQIKSLEQLLGLALFTRKTREVALTNAGKSFYQVASQTLRQYRTGFSNFKERYYSPTLKISMFSYIANEVVIPNLHQFQQNHPDIDLLIETSMEVEDLANCDLDCAIRFGIPPWKDCHHDLISPVSSNLLASRDYLENNPFNEMTDLQGQTLIHIRTNTNDWHKILTNLNITPGNELFFTSYTAAIKAAEQGLGIVIGLFPTTEKIIHEGKLQTLLPNNIPTEAAYYFVTKANDTKQDNYDLLLGWLKTIFQNLKI